MSDNLSEYMFANMVRPPRKRGQSRRGRKFTGAAISNATLVIATVETNDIGELRLCEEDTEMLVLEGRTQRHAKCFSREIEEFIKERGIGHVLLRASADSGRYPAAPASYMIEAILNLVKGLQLEIVLSQSLTAWTKRLGAGVPACPEGLPSRLRQPFEHAILSACLCAAWERDPSLRPPEKGQ